MESIKNIKQVRDECGAFMDSVHSSSNVNTLAEARLEIIKTVEQFIDETGIYVIGSLRDLLSRLAVARQYIAALYDDNEELAGKYFDIRPEVDDIGGREVNDILSLIYFVTTIAEEVNRAHILEQRAAASQRG